MIERILGIKNKIFGSYNNYFEEKNMQTKNEKKIKLQKLKYYLSFLKILQMLTYIKSDKFFLRESDKVMFYLKVLL